MGIHLILLGILILFIICGCCVFFVNCGMLRKFAKLPFSICGCCACLLFLIAGIVSVSINSAITNTFDYSCGVKPAPAGADTYADGFQKVFTGIYSTSR
jgi:hypothetical protein